MREPEVERERYELVESPRYLFEADRRDFLRSFGTGLVVLLVAPKIDGQQESGRGAFGDRMPPQVSAWLRIDEAGAVTVFTGKTEIGQNIRTSLTQAVAEELRATVPSITLVMADTAKTPFDMGTFGSRTTPTMNVQLRKVAAAARQVLLDRAAKRWSVPVDAVTAGDGHVHGPSAQSIAFGELMKGEPFVTTITEATVTEAPKDWTVAGTPVAKINGRDFVTGRHRYTSDTRLDGMLHAKVVRPPAFGSTLVRVDTTAASAMPGVVAVHDGNFVGVTAPTPAQAAAAAAAVEAEWTDGPGASARTLFADLKEKTEGNGGAPFTTGSVDEALLKGAVRVDADYTVAYIAHSPLEPRAALADWKDRQLTVWTGSQRPFGVQQELMDAFHLPAERVRVIVPDTGSAYGGKHTGDAAIEAARLSRASGKPVKLTWTREEEFAWAYFRPAGVITIRAAADKAGTLTAWEYHNFNSGPAAIRTPYEVANQRIAFHPSRSPLRQGSYRGLAATANHFARESHMDDLAHALHQDRVEFRLRNIKDDRLAAVLNAAAHRIAWNGRTTVESSLSRRGMGIACGIEKGGYTATAVELDVDRAGAVALRKVVVAFECGAIVNPNGLHNQVEGSVVQGLGGALFEAIDFEAGKLTNGRFSQYRLPRFSDVPAIDVVLLDRRDIPSAGAGETPIVGIAPAIGNAIFAATGVRLRSMPLVPTGMPAATHQ